MVLKEGMYCRQVKFLDEKENPVVQIAKLTEDIVYHRHLIGSGFDHSYVGICVYGDGAIFKPLTKKQEEYLKLILVL